LGADLLRADPFGADLGQQGGFDALIADTAGVAVGVLVADCVPVLLADPVAGVVAAAHAGRKGLLGGVLTTTLDAMRRRGARTSRILAGLGPSAGPCCYEVPLELRTAACAILPQLSADTTWGTPSLDLRAGCRAVLESAGVADVRSVGGCTIEDDSLYSYRRAPVTGRFAGVVMMPG
jgi:YfiH family protein